MHITPAFSKKHSKTSLKRIVKFVLYLKIKHHPKIIDLKMSYLIKMPLGYYRKRIHNDISFMVLNLADQE